MHPGFGLYLNKAQTNTPNTHNSSLASSSTVPSTVPSTSASSTIYINICNEDKNTSDVYGKHSFDAGYASDELAVVGFYNTPNISHDTRAASILYSFLYENIQQALPLDLNAVRSHSPSFSSNFIGYGDEDDSKYSDIPSIPSSPALTMTMNEMPNVRKAVNVRMLCSAPEAHNDLTVLVILEPTHIFEILNLYANNSEKDLCNIGEHQQLGKRMRRAFELSLMDCYKYLERRIQSCVNKMEGVFFVAFAILQRMMSENESWNKLFCDRNERLMECAMRFQKLCKKNNVKFYSFMTSVNADGGKADEYCFPGGKYGQLFSDKNTLEFKSHQQILDSIQSIIYH